MKNILIINAHQPFEGISPGKLNQTMVDVITEEMKGRGYSVRHTEINKVRIPRDGGHDSILMADSVPASSRTAFHGDGGQHSILKADTPAVS